MLLSIDKTKVEELTASLRNVGYAVSPSLVDAKIESICSIYPNYPPGGTTFSAHNLVTPESKKHLSALRREIERSGIPLVDADALESELREMRR